MAGNTANIRIRMDADLKEHGRKKGESYCKPNNVVKKEKLLFKRNHRVTNIRKNDLNQTISEIGNRKPGFIDVEDLDVSGMMKHRGL